MPPASGDDFAIHPDDDFARAVGLPGRIVHGLCTMAFAARAVSEAAAVDDRRRVDGRGALLGAAFSRRPLITRVWCTDGDYGLKSLGGDGAPFFKDGLLELG